MVLVPSMVHQLVNHTKFETTDWSSVIGGAAYLPPDLAKRYLSRIGGECFAQGQHLIQPIFRELKLTD